MRNALHHQHLRARKPNSEHPYPTRDPKIKALDNSVTIISLAFPLTALPQIYNVWILKQTQGVSLVMWVLLLAMQIPLLIYATVHKDKRMQFMFGLWCIMEIVMIGGLLTH